MSDPEKIREEVLSDVAAAIAVAVHKLRGTVTADGWRYVAEKALDAAEAAGVSVSVDGRDWFHVPGRPE